METPTRRRRRQTAEFTTDVVSPLSQAIPVEPEEQRREEDGAAEASTAPVLAENPHERSYRELFDAIPPEVLAAATASLRPEELVCVCMDDRNPDDGVYSAGGMILLGLDDAVEQIGKLGITVLKSHPGCAAGVVLAQRRGLPADQGDDIAIQQSMLIAERAGVRYAGASAVDPGAPHTARSALIFVDIPVRRSQLRGYLPQAFYVSGVVYPHREALITEALLPARIALEAGDEFSRAFSRETPFSVVFVGRDKDAVRELSAIFEARMQAVLPVSMSERIRVSTVF